MKSITLEVEMLLPTQVTKVVEMPLYLFCKKHNSYHHYTICDTGYQWSAVKEVEVKFYWDNTIRLYKHTLSENQFARIVALIESEYEMISKDEFVQAYKLYVNQEIETLNELVNQK